MALLEDQIEEAQAAFVAAHEANDTEGAQVLANHLRDLQEQKAAVDTATKESSRAGTDLRNPAIASLGGALIGATVNPVRGAIHNIVTPPVASPKITVPAPSSLSGQLGQGGENWTKSLTGVDIPNAQMNKGSLDTAQRMANTVGRGGELAGGRITEGGIMLGPEIGAKPAPVPPRTMGTQTKEAGKNLLQGIAGEPHPMTPFSIIKGGARGAITGAAAADVPQQIAQGNYGTAAADTGIGMGNIIHGLARTPKGKAIGSLIGLGSGVTRGYQGVNELMPQEQKADGGLVHLAGGGVANALTQTAINAPFIAPTAAGIAKNVGKGAYAPAIEDAASLGLAIAPLNPLTAGLSLMAPGEAGAGSTVDEWNAKKAAEEAARQHAQKQFEHEEFMRTKVGANAPKYFEDYLVQKARKMAAGGEVLKAGANLAKKAFNYDKYKLSQVYPDVIPPVLATDAKTGKEFLQKQLSPEAIEVQKARKAAQKQIDAGNYQPHFDINQRYYADPSHYPTAGYTQTDIVPKKAETIAKYTELANDPESLARLRGAFEKAKDRPAAKDWYAMGQLEDAFIKELGPEEGRKQFKARFADAMAATTGGADPNSNLMMAAFTNYQKGLGKEIPTKAADLPFPIGGRFVSGNMEQAKKLAEMGEIPVTNPKRHNFSANFLGHRDVSTLDEQMSQLWDPKMMSPPPNAYGIYQQALAKEAERAGVNPVNFQDIAWAGAKDYPGKPMMQEINEMLARTHAITGEPQEEILKGFIYGNKPMYGIGAAGGLGTLDIPEEQKFAPGGKVGAAKKLFEEAQAAYKAKFTPDFYHGSPNPNITAFDPLKSTVRDTDFVTPGVTFVTKHPKFADSFTNGKGPYISLKTGEAMPAQNYSKGSTMYPVSVDMSNHFDPTTPEGREIVRAYVSKKYAEDPAMASKFTSRIENPHSNWTTMEIPSFLQHLRDTGHTSFAVNESGYPNVGVLDPSKIRGKFAKFNPEDAESPDFMKAEGGSVEHFQVGGLAKLAKYAHGQDPNVAKALEEYLKGNISQEERIRIMNQFLPIRQWNELPPNYTNEQIKNALMANKQAKALALVPAGAQVGNRLDIPAYTQHGVYVDTTHDLTAGNSPISYNRTGHLTGVDFSSKPNQAVRVGLGTKEQALTPMGAEMGSAKSPFALIKGTNVGTSDDEVRRMMAEMMKDPNYTQIGMDPRRHSQFYDKSTGMPVWSAEEKLQSGPLIIAPKKGLETTSWDDPRLNLSDFPGKKYNKGGKV